MGWSGSRAVLGVLCVVLASCTSESDAGPATSITLGAQEVAAVDDSIVRYGISSSPSDPWAHYRTSCDTSCGLVFSAVTDTLFATTTDGSTVGMLVESFQANNDSTIHTWTLRSGVAFTDGTEFDAAAAKVNIDACRHSALTAAGLAGIDDVRADGQTLTITTLAPWATLAAHFAETPCGHMFSGAWLRSLADLPMRTVGAPFFDEAIASLSPVGDATAPVGLGAFTMSSFEPGNGNSTLLDRNPDYWRGPDGITAETLPTARQIELVVIGDDSTRRAGLEAGQFDLIHTRSPEEVEAVDQLGPSIRSDAFGDIVHVVYNAVDEPANPLRFVSCRRAIDRSIDRDGLAASFGQQASAGPLGRWPGSADIDKSDGPFDPTAGSQWAQRCVEDHGGEVALRLAASTGDERASVVAEMIEDTANAGGSVRLSIEVVPTEVSELAVAALLGEFDIVLWEGFSGPHPDLHFRWWFSEAGAPVGSFATNVGRVDDPALDRALVDVRRADDSERLTRVIEEADGAFRAGAWATWISEVEWVVGVNERVDVDVTRTSPEGAALVPIINGVHSLHRIGSS